MFNIEEELKKLPSKPGVYVKNILWNQNHMRLFDICNCRERDEIREKIMFNIEEELKKLPSKPGVYLMHDEKDDIIYVGKAISLKNRVGSIFKQAGIKE